MSGGINGPHSSAAADHSQMKYLLQFACSADMDHLDAPEIPEALKTFSKKLPSEISKGEILPEQSFTSAADIFLSRRTGCSLEYAISPLLLKPSR